MLFTAKVKKICDLSIAFMRSQPILSYLLNFRCFYFNICLHDKILENNRQKFQIIVCR